jgi:DNA-binding response OmpR family regulator
MNILLIEDNLKLSENIKAILSHSGYNIEAILTGNEGIYYASVNNYDLIILDLNLPDIDGIEVCKQIRAKQIKTPILMLTARINIESKVEGLNIGADDYLTKPFLSEELLARIRALTRRNSQNKTSEINLKNISLNLASHILKKDNREISLSPIELKIFEFLALNQGTAKNPTEIYESVWGNTEDLMFSDTLKVHIANIRQKLGKEVIETVNGFGYIIK